MPTQLPISTYHVNFLKNSFTFKYHYFLDCNYNSMVYLLTALRNYLFLKNYVTSEGAVSHYALYYQQLSIAQYQVSFYANNYFKSLPIVSSAFKWKHFYFPGLFSSSAGMSLCWWQWPWFGSLVHTASGISAMYWSCLLDDLLLGWNLWSYRCVKIHWEGKHNRINKNKVKGGNASFAAWGICVGLNTKFRVKIKTFKWIGSRAQACIASFLTRQEHQGIFSFIKEIRK